MMNSFNVVMILVVIVFVQAITSMVHIKYYQKKIRATVDKYNNGFLGVGTTKKFLKVGKVAILVIDARGSDASAVPTGKAGRGETTVASRARTDADRPEDTRSSRANPVTYLQQVVEELRKVIWPTRNQMITYTVVVFLFLIFMTALVSGVDFGTGKLVELVFDR